MNNFLLTYCLSCATCEAVTLVFRWIEYRDYGTGFFMHTETILPYLTSHVKGESNKKIMASLCLTFALALIVSVSPITFPYRMIKKVFKAKK